MSSTNAHIENMDNSTPTSKNEVPPYIKCYLRLRRRLYYAIILQNKHSMSRPTYLLTDPKNDLI